MSAPLYSVGRRVYVVGRNATVTEVLPPDRFGNTYVLVTYADGSTETIGTFDGRMTLRS